jgi:hypothetical protein
VSANSAWETIRQNIHISAKESLGYYELKKHNPWFDKGGSKLFDQSKQAKLQWLGDPSKINRDKREYLKGKINELATNSKNKNIRDLYIGRNEWKSGYKHRGNLVKDKLPGRDQIQAELIQAAGETLLSESHELSISILV